MSQSALGSRRERVSVRHLDARAAVSAWHRERASPSEQAWHREPVILPEEVRRDVRAAVCRGGQRALRRGCCLEPALRLAQVSWSAQGLSSVWGSLPAQLSQGEPQAPRSEQAGLP